MSGLNNSEKIKWAILVQDKKYSQPLKPNLEILKLLILSLNIDITSYYNLVDLYSLIEKNITEKQVRNLVLANPTKIGDLTHNLWQQLSGSDIKLLQQIYTNSAGGKGNVKLAPFFFRCLSPNIKPKNKINSSFVYLTNKITYTKTKLGLNSGFTPEQILTSPFLCLTHVTYARMEDDEDGNRYESAAYLETIFKSGSLSNSLHRLKPTEAKEVLNLHYPKKGVRVNWHNVPLKLKNVRLEQYPGVYCNLETSGESSGNFAFVLSLALLRKKGWHIRGDSPYGGYGALIDSTVWDSTTFEDYLKTSPNNLNFSEMIFHYPIPLDYVEYIVCGNEKYRTNILGYMKNTKWFNIPVYVKNEPKHQKLEPIKKVKFLYSKTGGPYSDQPPNLCYNSNGEFEYDRPGKLSNFELRNTLMNCGFDDLEARKLIKNEDYDDLLKLITTRGVESIVSGKYYLPKVHPPHISKSKLDTKKKLTIFSWNVKWNQRDEESIDIIHKTVKRNIADIYAFQELNNIKTGNHWSQLGAVKYALDDSLYTKFSTKSGEEEMYVFIKNKLNPKMIGRGHFEIGRPFLMILLTFEGKEILFINVHLSHPEEIEKTELKQKNRTINEKETKILNLAFDLVKPIKIDRLILAGDFNSNVDYVQISGLIAYNTVSKTYRDKNYTCCNEFSLGVGTSDAYGMVDHILDSEFDTKKTKTRVLTKKEDIVNPYNNIGSDHSPLLSVLD